jgi:hypothetical protein
MNLDRAEYGEIYHRTFGKGAAREACRKGWERWQTVLASGTSVLVLHPHGAPMPAPHANDYWAFATLGPLRFLARINETLLPQLPEMWLAFTRDEHVAKLLATVGQNPRTRARGFIQNSLVDGYVIDPAVGPAMAGAIAWLLSTIEGMPTRLSDYHLFGYDISYVPGPPGQARMFNFRAILNAAPEQTEGMLDIARRAVARLATVAALR